MAQQNSNTIIIVKCIGYNNVSLKCACDFSVCANTLSGETVFEGKVDENGIVRFPVKYNAEYQISVHAPFGFSPGIAHRWIRFTHNCNMLLYFVFSHSIGCCPIYRKILLSDRHYANLPILEGEIKLWQNPIVLK